MEWYPLAFEPIMKKVLWGGSALADFKQLPFDSPQTGESWEISAVEGSVSLLGNGALKGKKLDELISLDPEGLLGSKVYEGYGADFPLLIKWIDTAADLSIQVHPDDAFARTQGRRFGKTELWYVVSAEPEARLIAGFNKKLSREEYLRRIAENSIEEVLLQHPVQAGDVFMIPPGRVHSIGKGILLAEIQQSSDITYRIYDFNRKDDQGNARPLHTELAAQCLDFGHYSDYKTTYPGLPNQAVELNRNKYFRVNRLELKAGEPKSGESKSGEPKSGEPKSGDSKHQALVKAEKPLLEMERNPAGGKSFVVYMCLEGALELHCSNGSSGCLSRGRTLLIPAAAGSCLLQCKDAALVLEIFAEC
ncbi:MAG: mannose-6-phosphate isomerase [Bacteroidales bacterium]|nr:mannose-6-phosphate isomerase [Bacteroidales bacterium]